MPLTTQLAQDFDDRVRKQGQAYYSSNTVKILEGNDRSVWATVQGGKKYHVHLTRTKKAIKAGCTCPYFQENLDYCKHIWATLLAAELRGFLKGDGSTGQLEMRADENYMYDDGLYGADEDDYDRDEWDDPTEPTLLRPPQRSSPTTRKGQPANTDWKRQLATMHGANGGLHSTAAWPLGREVLYIVDVPATMLGQGLIVELAYRERKANGEWGKPRAERIMVGQITQLPNEADRSILALLVGGREHSPYYGGYGMSNWDSAPAKCRLSAPLADELIPRMCRTGRCQLRLAADTPELTTLQWDEGEPWEFRLEVEPDPTGKHYLAAGWLRRGAERVSLAAPRLLTEGGLVFWDDRAARLRDFGAFQWISMLRQRGPLKVPVKQGGELVKELLKVGRLPRLELPADLRFEEVAVKPQPRLRVHKPERRQSYGADRLHGDLSFDYDGLVVPTSDKGRGAYQPERRRLMIRDEAAERAAAEQLHELGFRPQRYAPYGQESALELTPKHLPRVVRALLDAGWHVEADGSVYRSAGDFHIEVKSGIDWFDLEGSVQFGDTSASLPELLAALKKGENTVKLDDGTFGILPEDWLKKYGLLAGLGKVEGDNLRFSRSQVGLLDALLAAQPEATFDAGFTRAREELRQFDGIKAIDPPAGFVGELRGYQREGLGWLHFLQRFGFGGCLADDMGLGKTVQVLALLESRRELRADKKDQRLGPSLVVVPRSLVFNWKQEAARFTPQLRILDHTGTGRQKAGEHFNDHDVILTTYGTLRRDAADFRELHFDYCILDESQAVKNSRTEAAKAVRLVRADHRLAMSGTPVENHLGELWSLFEFLNPGMLGGTSVFRLGGAGARNPDEDTRGLLAKALRPFILRRTKDQVAKELPAKVEQTLFCELEGPERKRYNELREHYQRALLDKVAREGMNKAKIMVLEALLRLRQAACHPGLIDKDKVGESSAKLDMLLPQLSEVNEEGHKALVFSQFTSLLAIVRQRLDKEGVIYEYLDGQTRDRAARVERFQNDPECKLFLISLKAGGLGLNLTAAEYVFLLDPWWNPAVEAQAIDRAHRIGQKRHVFAYRVIARDTVEEKVLELQKTKRALADAIINADNSLVRNLTADDLQLLLS